MHDQEASILVTGASSGIGAALAHQLAGRGARLTLAARRHEQLGDVAESIRRRHAFAAPPHVVPADLSLPGEPSRLIRETIAHWGGIDTLINNAGISVYGETDCVSTADVRRVMEVNYFAAVEATLEVLPHFEKRGRGLVINVASLAALHGVPYLSAYGASKAALANFSQSLRAELRGQGIRIMVVYPNYTDTEIFAKEKRAGQARRPEVHRASAASVAGAIVRAMEREEDELVLTPTGRVLRGMRGLAPSVLDQVMARMASRLRTNARRLEDREALP